MLKYRVKVTQTITYECVVGARSPEHAIAWLERHVENGTLDEVDMTEVDSGPFEVVQEALLAEAE